LLATTTRKIVSAVWKQFGFFRDAPIMERRRQGGYNGSCWLEFGIRESCGVVMLQIGFGVVIGAGGGFSLEDCSGLPASMCACKNMVDKELRENRGGVQRCQSRGYVAGCFLLIMDLLA
jgi:hypothetical protein